MKFQTIIIGGGLSGLMAGIKLAKAGRKVAIVSSGQSALHFGSGSFELLGSVNGRDVANPLAEMASLPANHPYTKIGAGIADLISEVQPTMEAAGIKLNGSATQNHYRITPLGKMKSAWLTLDDFATFEKADAMPWKKVVLVNIKGFLDFQHSFLALGFDKCGTECRIETISTPMLEQLRKSTSEMRAPNIARVLTYDNIDQIAGQINKVAGDGEAVFLPAIIGLNDTDFVEYLRKAVNKPLYFISTMPTSVPGVRMQVQLREYFKRLGGTYFLGDNVVRGEFVDNRLHHIFTANLGDDALSADDFILATGSFFSHGLIARLNKIEEPTFGLDVVSSKNRVDWFDKNIYADQPFMAFGVATDSDFRVAKDGTTVTNTYATGSVLAGCNALKDGCGAGVAILTALHVASNILKK